MQFIALLAAVIVGCSFGYVVAGNDRGMQIFLSATVAAGLFFVFSAFATQLNRKSRLELTPLSRTRDGLGKDVLPG